MGAANVVVLNYCIDLFFNLFKLVLLFILFGLVYGVYYIIYYAYPRIFTLGHTESGFDDYMVNYYTELIGRMQKLEKQIPSCKAFLDIYKKKFGQDLRCIDTDFTINGSLHLHLLIMFYKDIDKQDEKTFGHAFDILNNQLVQTTSKVLQDMYTSDKPPYINISKDTWDKFTSVKGALANVKADVTNYKSNVKKVDAMLLSVMLNNYFDGTHLSKPTHDHIQRMYDLRKIGGFANFQLLKIYVGDYFDYIFKQKIPIDIWGNFKEEMTTLADKVLTAITADSVLNWFLTLPSKLAGTESFENPIVAQKLEDFKETFIANSPYGKDVREPFVDSLIKIAKTFVSMFQVLISIVNIISDPVAFIKFLIGSIIAIILYIIYFILVNIQIAVAIAYVYIILMYVSLTVFWALLCLVFVIFYAILSIMDLPLGGFIMRSLRCENLPDAWTRNSNWHKGNMFTRTFFCSRSCRKGFYPYELAPLCVKQPDDQPIWAPHQVIYNAFMNNEYISTVRDKILYNHTPDYKYYTTMTEDKKRDLWKKVYSDRATYNTECVKGSGGKTGFRDYDPLIREMCVDFYKDTDLDKDSKQTIIGLCQNLYCTEDNDFAFCQDQNKSDLLGNAAPPKDLIKIIIISSIIIVILVILFAYLLKTDKGGVLKQIANIDIVKAFKDSNILQNAKGKLDALHSPGLKDLVSSLPIPKLPALSSLPSLPLPIPIPKL